MTDGSPGAGRVTLSGVSQRFRSASGDWTDALGPIDLDLEPGSFVSLVGPSGCGKSTLLRLIAGFDRPDAGSVTVGDRIVAAPGPDRGVVFQQPNLYPWLTVAGNVEFGPRRRRVPRSERATLVAEHLELVGLSEFAGHRPYELSGGMQQRVQLARVLANRPSIVLMDEPFGALDALTRDRLQDELLRIWRVARPTVLFITHSVEEAIYLGTRVLVLSPRPGRVVADLRPDFSTSGAHGPEVRSDRDFVEMRARVGAYLQ
ncbi:MAG: ABC transporter ATP-binding protein [Acidimicrobiales bacterium]